MDRVSGIQADSYVLTPNVHNDFRGVAYLATMAQQAGAELIALVPITLDNVEVSRWNNAPRPGDETGNSAGDPPM